jgi:two-component system, OmpR family, sensor histidine kinase VicK
MCYPVMIYADHDKIGSVITNLISNAVKYSPKGKEIDIKCEVIGGRAQVSVKDEGTGLKPQDKDKVFTLMPPRSCPSIHSGRYRPVY